MTLFFRKREESSFLLFNLRIFFANFHASSRVPTFAWANFVEHGFGLELRHRALRLHERRNPNFVFLSSKLLHFCRFYFETFFAELFFNPSICESALFSEFASWFCFVCQTLWRDQFFTEWTSADSSKMFLARLTRHSPTRILPQGFLDLSLNFFHFVIASFFFGEELECVETFVRFLLSWWKLH